MRTLGTKIKGIVWLSALAVAMTFSACSTVEDGSYVAPITQNEKMEGKWTVNTVTQVDETNQKSMDITGLFGFNSFSITLNSDGTGALGTFTVDGTAPALLPTSGSWCLANPYVNADGSSAQLLLNDQTALTVTTVPGATKSLEFKLTRTSNGNAFVSYVYNLTSASAATDEAGE